MWEQTKKNGTYMCERVTDKATGKSRILSVKVRSLTRTGRKEAREKLREKIENEQPKRMKLSKLIELYLKEHEQAVKLPTYYRDEKTMQNIVKILDDPYIDCMNAGYIRQKFLETGKKASWMNEKLKRFKTFLMWAYRNDFMPREVADKLTSFQTEKVDKLSNKYLEKEELNKLLEAMDIEYHKLVTEFLALSGLRIGELMALDDADVTDEYINVHQNYNSQLCYLGTTKTTASTREVYIQPELAECIKKIRTCMKRQRLMYGYTDKGYFVYNLDGHRYAYAPYHKYLHQVAEKVLPDKKVTPHVLRHTMTSLFAEAGVDLETIARRLGHEDSDITRSIYLHVTEKVRERDNEKVSKVSLLNA